MNQETTSHDVQSQDLAAIVSRFRRHLPISAAIIAAAVILAVVGTQFMPRHYTATARLSYGQQELAVNEPGSSGPPMTDAQRDAAVEAQMQLVLSLPVATRVIQMLGLEKDPELRARAAAFEGGPSKDAMAAALLTGAGVNRIGQTELFHINYTDEDPLKAAKLANAFAEAYLEVQTDQKRKQMGASGTQLDERVQELRRQAELADAQVAAFRLNNNVLNAVNSPALENEIATINQSLAVARSEAAKSRIQSGSTAVNDGIDVGALSNLRSRRAEAQQVVNGLSARYGDLNPQLIEAKERLASIDSALSQEQERVSQGATLQAAGAAASAASLQSSLNQSQAALAKNVRASVQLADLQRQADISRQLYQNLLALSGGQAAKQALAQPDAHLVALATPPLTPTSPRLLVNLVVAFALGAAIALALAYVRERWSQTLNTIDDINRYLGVPYLNSVPTLQSAIDNPKTDDPAEAVMLHPMSSFAEAFRSLATTLLFAARENVDTTGGRVIGISSALPGEGKTTTTIGMARVLAMTGKRVAIVDIDLRRRSVTQALAPSATKGWIEMVQQGATFEEVAVQDQSGATIFPAAPGSHETQRLFDGDEFGNFITFLRERYEVVIIDTAPVLAIDDTRSLSAQMDAFALMARWRSTPVKAIRAALHQLGTVGRSVAGVAMTMVNLKTQAQAGYGDASYYYHEIKDYYNAR